MPTMDALVFLFKLFCLASNSNSQLVDFIDIILEVASPVAESYFIYIKILSTKYRCQFIRLIPSHLLTIGKMIFYNSIINSAKRGVPVYSSVFSFLAPKREVFYKQKTMTKHWGNNHRTTIEHRVNNYRTATKHLLNIKRTRTRIIKI